MSTWVDPNALTATTLGLKASKAYTLAAETASLFTVSGLVYVSAIVGEVTTAMTVANTVKLVANPTTGTASDLCAATDLGTTDTPAGNLLSISGAPTGAPVSGIGAVSAWPIAKVSADYLGAAKGLFLSAGVVQQVTTGTGPDGVIAWHVFWVPVATGATVTAA